MAARRSRYAIQLPPALKPRGASLKRVLSTRCATTFPLSFYVGTSAALACVSTAGFREHLRSYVNEILGSPQARVRAHPGAR